MQDGRAGYRIAGGDPQILFEGDWQVEARQAAIAVRLRNTQGSHRNAQLFWGVDGGPLSEAQSHRHNWQQDSLPHTYLFTFRPEHVPNGRLTAIRIDPPWGTGALVEIEWVRLLRLEPAAPAE